MTHLDTRIVIVGGGQAGLACAAKLRALGHRGPLVLLSAEPEPPYQRPPLSKAHLLGEMTKAQLALRPAGFYHDQGIDLRLGAKAEKLDPEARRLRLAGGEELDYDELVLATGAAPRRLPAALSGGHPLMHVLRDVADSDRLRPFMKPGARLLVIGGGFIGLEVAASARKLGLEVALIEAAPRILMRALAPESADELRRLHLAHGVELIEGVGLAALAPEGAGLRARLTDGREIRADFALAGVGVTPEVSLLAAAGAQAEEGVLVDSRCRAGPPHVWAVGDCAAFLHEGRRLRIESVGNAIDMAECAAANILGAEQDYAPKPWFWSDQYGVKLQIAGLAQDYDQLVVRPGANGHASYWYLRKGRLAAVDSFGDARAHMIARRLAPNAPEMDPAKLADPAVDLKSLMG